MNEKLQSFIEEARFKVRRADGVPLSDEEVASESRKKQLKDLEAAIYSSITNGYVLGSMLPEFLWDGKAPFLQLTVSDRKFNLYREEYEWRLFAAGEKSPLITINVGDPLFTERLTVAISDFL